MVGVRQGFVEALIIHPILIWAFLPLSWPTFIDFWPQFMPFKHTQSKRHHFKKHTYRQFNYAEYNQSLRDRGRIDIWLSDEIIKNWQSEQRTYDGTGSSPQYPDSTLIACHYLRLVFKQPLRPGLPNEHFLNKKGSGWWSLLPVIIYLLFNGHSNELGTIRCSIRWYYRP